jgi:hypothetical protein
MMKKSVWNSFYKEKCPFLFYDILAFSTYRISDSVQCQSKKTLQVKLHVFIEMLNIDK